MQQSKWLTMNFVFSGSNNSAGNMTMPFRKWGIELFASKWKRDFKIRFYVSRHTAPVRIPLKQIRVISDGDFHISLWLSVDGVVRILIPFSDRVAQISL
jgi:hypothetical protein